MRVLQINVVYPNGSTGKIVKDIHDELIKNNHESLICYGRGAEVSEKNVYKIAHEFIMKAQSFRAKATGYTYGGCFFSTRNLINIIRNENPDVVHIHCINGYMVNIYKLLNYLKNNRIATVLTLHAEFMYTAGCGYALDCEKWKSGCFKCPQFKKGRPSAWFFDRSKDEWERMKKAFEGFENLTICPVSNWLKSRAMQSLFMSDKKMITVTNGIDVNVFKQTNFQGIKQKLGLKDEKIILHVTPNFLSEIKGGKYVLDIARRFQNKNTKILIVGYNGNYKELPTNVIPILHTNSQAELAAYYSMANITLLTSEKETFSMICAESLCCGTPIVGFEAGAPETISIPEYSEFVTFGDVNTLETVVSKWLKTDICKQQISENAKTVYSSEIMCGKYIKVYNGEF